MLCVVHSIAIRMMRITSVATLTARNTERAPQRIGASFEGILGFGGPLFLISGFSPGMASSTPSLAGAGGFSPLWGFSLISGLIIDGTIFFLSNQEKKEVVVKTLIKLFYVHRIYL